MSGKIDDIFIEYLKMIQDIIKRLAHNSFLVKGWSVAIFAGVVVLTFELKNFFIGILLGIIVVMFWMLDSYYLRQERLFRKKYEDVISKERDEIKLFDLSLIGLENEVQGLFRTLFSISEILFYFPFIIAVVTLIISWFF